MTLSVPPLPILLPTTTFMPQAYNLSADGLMRAVFPPLGSSWVWMEPEGPGWIILARKFVALSWYYPFVLCPLCCRFMPQIYNLSADVPPLGFCWVWMEPNGPGWIKIPVLHARYFYHWWSVILVTMFNIPLVRFIYFSLYGIVDYYKNEAQLITRFKA